MSPVVTVKSLSGNSHFPFFVQPATVMLLISGALVNGPYALITTAVSADLVSLTSPSASGVASLASRESPFDFCRVISEGAALSQSKGIRRQIGSPELSH